MLKAHDDHGEHNVALRAPTPIFARFSSDPEFAAFFKFVHRLEAVPGVAEIRFATTDETVHLWVLTHTDDLETNRTILRTERAFREAQGQSSMQLHLVPMSDVDVSNLPPAEVLAPANGR